jgi:hypothetical protein
MAPPTEPAYWIVSPFGSTASSFPGAGPVIATTDWGPVGAESETVKSATSVIESTTVSELTVTPVRGARVVAPCAKCVFVPRIVTVTALPGAIVDRLIELITASPAGSIALNAPA